MAFRMTSANDSTAMPSAEDTEPFTVIGDVESKGVLDRLKSGKDWIESKRATLQPWSRFFELAKFSLPKSFGNATRRIATNVSTFQSNYVFVCLVLVAYCIVTNPMMMFAMALCIGVWWYVSIKNGGKSIKFINREVSPREVYIALVLVSIPLFYFSAAGSTVFWLIGASLVVVLAHSVLLRAESNSESVDILLEEVTVAP